MFTAKKKKRTGRYGRNEKGILDPEFMSDNEY
jgi:hypothetical protein